MNLLPLGLCLAAFAAGLFSTAARALRGFSRRDLENRWSRNGGRKQLDDLLRRADAVAQTAEMAAYLAWLAAIGFASALWRGTALQPVDPQDAWPAWAFGLAMAGGTLAILVWIPAAVAAVAAAAIAFRGWPAWRLLDLLMRPFGAVARLLVAFFRRLAGQTPQVADSDSFDDVILSIVGQGQRSGLLEPDERQIIESVLELGDATVSQIMTPRTDMYCLQVDEPLDQALTYIRQSGHTRFPVYGQSRDDMLGVLHAKDVLGELASAQENLRGVRQLMRPAMFVPQTRLVRTLLHEFRRTQNHLAIVLDEYGGVAGLVTIEDILEELVGEIADEHDDAPVDDIHRVDEQTADADARARIDDVNDRLGLELNEEGDFDTVGGLVLSELGHVPVAGEQVVCGGVRFTVLQASRRRIERVRIEILPEAE